MSEEKNAEMLWGNVRPRDHHHLPGHWEDHIEGINDDC